MLRRLALAFAVTLLTLSARAHAQLGPDRLAIYYGYPSLVEGANGNLSQAASTFSTFDIVVLGDGLEHAAHPDHANTQSIISTVIGSGTQIYGYVDMGVSTQNLAIATAEQYVDEWAAIGVTGIFWDDAGFDYNVDRNRQKTLIDYTHGTGLKAFVNAWVPDDIFAVSNGTPTPLVADDWYLAESHPVANAQFADLGPWWSKSQSLATYRSLTNVKIAAIATGDDGALGWPNAAAYRQSLWAAYLFGWDAFGFTNAQYSASGSGANRLRTLPPVATAVGSSYTGNPTMVSAIKFTRTTDNGTIEVTGDSSGGYGTFYGGACNTQPLGTSIWPNCSSTPPAQSSPFGPRQKASEGYRYDFHRGVDIPQPVGFPVYAMRDGIMRVAGADPNYSDLLVQVRHNATAPYLFSNVLHLDSAAVAVGDLVTVGDLIGYSGVGESGFAHMHMEFRDGCANQNCNRNPWGYLPYTDLAPVTPDLIGANLLNDQSVLLLEASTPSTQLDFDGVSVTWGGQTFTASINAINATTQQDFPEGLDHPVVDVGGGTRVCILPAQYNAMSAAAAYRFAFFGLPKESSGSAAGLDLHDSSSVPMTPVLPALTVSNPTKAKAAHPGDTLTFTHTVHNSGNAQVSLSISGQSAQTNPLSVTPANLVLNPGESADITVEVTLNPSFPVPIGDCVVVEIDDGGPHTLVVVDTAVSLWACDATPAPSCESGAHSALALKDAPNAPSRKKLHWKLLNGTNAAIASDFGDPVVGGNRYRLCVFDSTGSTPSLAVEANIAGGGTCAGKPCWKALSDKGYRYRNRNGNESAVTALKFKGGGAGKPALKLIGKGLDLPLPGAVGGTYFEVDTSLTVQLTESSTGHCWESVFDATHVKKNDAVQFRARR